MKYGILETVSISPQLPNEIKINEEGVTKERILEAITILCSISSAHPVPLRAIIY